jgi:hypothetical protein
VTALIVVFACIFAVLLAAFLWFYFYSRTVAWGESETRRAVLRMLVVIGPIFGMRYQAPRPEPPTISTPGSDDPPRLAELTRPADDEAPRTT